jgi:hypothetical protein
MSEDLQFDRAELPAQNTAVCRQCQAPLRDHYFQANGVMLCDPCVDQLRRVLGGSGSSAGRFLKALLLGTGAAALGAIGYGLFMGFTQTEFALVTIGIGWFVGKAVRSGSGGRGGWRYGLTAVLLTYLAISFSYLGVGLASMKSQRESAPAAYTAPMKTTASKAIEPARDLPAAAPSAAPQPKIAKPPMSPLVAIVTLLGLVLSIPVMTGFQSPLSLLITGFGLWKAWTMNRAAKVEITGPHLISDPAETGA